MDSHGVLAKALMVLVRAYQALRAGRPSPCRFEPTCSAYAMTALADHGTGRGAVLVLRRLGRCRPLGGHGWDPVPPPSPFARSASRPEPTSPIPQGKT